MVKRYKNLVFLGTSHVSKESVDSVKKLILKEEPKVVAIELDRERFVAMTRKKRGKPSIKSIKSIGFKGYLFGLLGAFVEAKIGKLTGVAPGSEMRTAIRLSKKEKIPIALIDQPIRVTLKNISSRITWKEKGKFVSEFFKAMFSKKEITKINFNKVPTEKQIEILSKKMKKDYPSIYKSLITDRDFFMSKNLNKISEDNPSDKVLVIVGAGHIKGIISNLKKNG